MKRSVVRWLAGAAALAAGLSTVSAAAGAGPDSDGVAAEAVTPTIAVDAATKKFTVAPVLPGANINKWYDSAQGLWNGTGPDPGAIPKMKTAGLGVLRFPGGTSANLYDWRRAVGPLANRGCQTDGEDLTGHTDNRYGPDEFMKLVGEAGAAPQIMVPFANESPAHAADWVEYMNASTGTNPNGGIAWADVRARNGHPEPYRVTRWEIGNEQDRAGGQRYWLSQDSGKALGQYIGGATLTFTDQAMGRDCDFRHTRSNGRPSQTFHLRYGLIRPGTAPKITVGGTEWNRVDDLSAVGPQARAYTLHRATGSVTFGDGTHGAVPPDGAAVRATYTMQHDGYAKMYTAMKQVAATTGTPIDVCATWAPISERGTDATRLGKPSFPAAMKARGLASRYDCLAMHPYTNFRRDFDGNAWDTTAEGHHQHMVGELWMRKLISHHRDDMKANAEPGGDGRRPYLATSELGALWFGDSPARDQSLQAFPNFSSTMTHSVYMASQFLHLARLDAGWVMGNTVVGSRTGLRGVLGGERTGYVYGAEAVTREVMKSAFVRGSTWVGSDVVDQPFAERPDTGKWPVLQVGATVGRDGKLRIVVVNRRMHLEQAARVLPRGFAHTATVEVTTVSGTSYTSYNDGVDGGGDDSVRLQRNTRTVSAGDFHHTFPAHSVTVLTLSPA
ncbi:MAG: hypothetical protein ACRDT6_28600, partial [Micromonosporaceae bacterium]